MYCFGEIYKYSIIHSPIFSIFKKYYSPIFHPKTNSKGSPRTNQKDVSKIKLK